jgi:glycosyltransferase involved in cell wall biosynthesis
VLKSSLKTARKLRAIPMRTYRFSKKKLRHWRSRFSALHNGASSAGMYAEQIKHFANPGPYFEEGNAMLWRSEGVKRAKTIAFYLPQFHRFSENDAWWGTGFSEWRNIARAAPRFVDHYQPRIPRDLGFYDLSHEHTIRDQAALAKSNGVDAFCFYYYRFNDKRLMEKPLDLFVESDIDHQFCIMWANENWTRTWDGSNDVLIKQDYLIEDEDAFIDDTAAYMQDDRYVRVEGRPVFILYRPGLLTNMKTTLARWRRKWTKVLGVEPLVMMVQGFGDESPDDYGFDAAIEFPPHKICDQMPLANQQHKILDPSFTGRIRQYKDVVDAALSAPDPDYPLIKGVTPSWDNDARRQGAGSVLHGSTPALYEQWLNGALAFAEKNPIKNESLVFINAWNEWAEGAYLEPDVYFGHAYLNATLRATHGLEKAKPVLLIGHDAHKHGAQMLLLNIATVLKTQLGQDIVILLKEGGALLADYRKVAPTHVLDGQPKNWLDNFLDSNDFDYAVTNTAVTGDLVPKLKARGLRVSSLVHEMPELIADYQLEEHIKALAQNSDVTVFAAEPVQEGFNNMISGAKSAQLIKPQGSYQQVAFDQNARSHLRKTLGVSDREKIVLNAGYADKRKGFDLFVQAAARSSDLHANVFFVWVGAIDAKMLQWLDDNYALGHPVHQQLKLVDFTENIAPYYSAADTFFLSSREDPYPTVVLEAMNAGLPVVVFRDNTGFDDLMLDYGYIATQDDPELIDDCLYTALMEDKETRALERIDYVNNNAGFEDYCKWLMELGDNAKDGDSEHDQAA